MAGKGLILPAGAGIRESGLEGLPFAIEQDQLFDIETFKGANPLLKSVIYRGPRDHLTLYGSGHPTQKLQIEMDDALVARALEIEDYRGKSCFKPREDFRLSHIGTSQQGRHVVLITDQGELPGISGIQGLPEEFDFLHGFHIAVFLEKQHGEGLIFKDTSDDIAEAVLRSVLTDWQRLDFSKSSLRPYRNEPARRLEMLGKELVVKSFDS